MAYGNINIGDTVRISGGDYTQYQVVGMDKKVALIQVIYSDDIIEEGATVWAMVKDLELLNY
jgi:hypothetical protein